MSLRRSCFCRCRRRVSPSPCRKSCCGPWPIRRFETLSRSAKSSQRVLEHSLRRTVAGQIKHHAAACHSDSRGNLQQAKTNRVDAPATLLCSRKCQPTNSVQQHIRERRQHQAKLVRHELRAACAIGEQTQLLFLDPVFHFAARTVQRAIKLFRILNGRAIRAAIFHSPNLTAIDPRSFVGGVDDLFAARDVRHHESRVGSLRRKLRLANHPAMTIPGFLSAIPEPFEDGLLRSRLRIQN